MSSSRIINRMSLTAMAAMASLGTAAIMAPPSPAGAVTSSIKCSNFGGAVGTELLLNGCNGKTGGSASAAPSTLVTGGISTISWLNGKFTKVETFAQDVGQGACPNSAYDQFDITGRVKRDTSGSAPVGGAVKFFVCESTFTINLVPGTTFVLK